MKKKFHVLILLSLIFSVLFSVNIFAAEGKIDVYENLEYTSTSFSTDNEIITEVLDKALGNTIIVSLYKESRMEYMQSYLVTPELTSISTKPDFEYDTVKVFVWDSLKTLKPICSIHNKNEACTHQFSMTYQDATCYSCAKYKKICLNCGYICYESVTPVTMSIDLEKSSYPIVGSNYDVGYTYYYTVSANGGNGNYTYKFTVINKDGSTEAQTSYSANNKYDFVYYSTCKLQVNVKDDKGNLAIYTYNAGDGKLLTSYSSPIDVIAHSYDECEISKEPTCTEQGTKNYICTMCNLLQTEPISAKGHSYSKAITPKDCSSNAIITYACSNCPYTYDTIVSDITIGVSQTVKQSIVTNGSSGYVREFNININGGYGTILCKYEIFLSSTATTSSQTIDFTDEHGLSIQYTGVYSKVNNYVLQITAKDDYGNVSKYRFRLGESSTIPYYLSELERNVAEIEHTLEQWEVAIEPNCTEEGIKTTKCLICDATFTDKIPAVGHTYREEDDRCNDCEELICYTDGLTFSLINNDAEYEVTGLGTVTDEDIIIPREYNGKPVTQIGENAFKSCKSATSVRVPSTVRYIKSFAFSYSNISKIIIPYSVETIDSYAFSGCTKLIEIVDGVSYVSGWAIECDKSTSNVVLRAGTKGIAKNAFYGCSNLISLTIPGTVKYITGRWLFDDCEKLECVVIQNGVEKIGEYTFADCVNLTSITLPGSIVSIGERAFSGCENLETVTLLDGIPTIGEYAFYNCTGLKNITIPNSVKVIGENAFCNCKNLEKVDLLNGTQSIGDYAFYGCTSLKSITIPSSVLTIGERAFYNCEGLESVVILNGTQSIGEYAFYGCANLNSITISNGVSTIGERAFSNCTSLTNILIPGSVQSIGECAFYGCENLEDITLVYGITTIGDSAFSGCANLTCITIPNTVSSIGRSAFYKCTSLTSATVPGNIQGKNLFSGCENLNHIGISNGSTRICDYAYSDMINLTSVTIPKSVTSIGQGAFYKCSNITSIHFDGELALWNNISKGNGWDLNTGDYVIYCTDADISKNGDLTYSGLTYEITDDEVTIIGCTDSIASVDIPTEIKGKSVTSIGDRAFVNCTNISSLRIPPSINSIGSSAFEGCTSLSNIYITDIDSWCTIDFSSYSSNPLYNGGKLYLNNTLLTKLNITTDITEISSGAFYNYQYLSTISIPASVTKIGRNAFYNTNWLNNQKNGIVYAGNVVYCYKGEMPTNTNIILNESTVGIADGAFSGFINLSSINIPDKVVYIGDVAFDGCTNLKDCVLPDTLIYIGSSAFRGCTSLTNVIVPDSVTEMGTYAFSYCTNLSSAKLSDNLLWIPHDTFYRCIRLEEVNIPQKATAIGTGAFSGCALKTIYIPKAMKNVCEDAFLECSIEQIHIEDLKAWCGIDITNGWTDTEYPFGSYDLYLNDTLITNLEVPENIDVIKPYSFAGCNSIEKVVLPSSVTEISYMAFGNCDNLKMFYINDNISNINYNAFGDWFIVTIYGNDNDYVKTYCQTNKIPFVSLNDLPPTIVSSGTCGTSSTYNILSDGTLQILGKGAMTSYSSGSSTPWYYYRYFIRNISIADTITSLGKNCFFGFNGLVNVDIPNNVLQINEGAFYGCDNLEEITLPFVGVARNKNNSVDSVLGYIFGYDSFGDAQYYNGNSYKVYRLPEKLSKITITDGSYIPHGAFSNCKTLECVNLPKSITEIKDKAFYNCNIKDVYFEGTKEEWKAIVIGNYNTPIYNALIHCSDGAIRYVIK